MKGVKEAMKKKGASEDEIKEFEKGAQSFAKKILGNFKDYEFLIGESMDPDGMYVAIPLLSYCLNVLLISFFYRVILLNYREDGITPYVTVWKHGLSEMKV
jgi:Translationally controlled tumour protein